MAQTQLGVVLRHLNRLLAEPSSVAPTDRQLLDRFLSNRDESAFTELLRRHGPMVLGVCRRLLAHGPDADDVFQATFLVFVHKAGTIRQGASLGCWLYGVAYRLALKARRAAARRRTHERRVADMRPVDVTGEPSWGELRPLLDEELARLPERLRAPLVLCYLEGKTHAEAARELGRPVGSMSKCLERGRELLRWRLTRRGMALSAATLALLLAGNAGAAVPAALGRATLQAGLAAAAGAGWGGLVSARAAGLVRGGLRDMFLAKCKLVLALVLSLGALGAGAGVLTAPPPAEPQPAADEQQAERSKAALNQDGDPLPAGALARLGTTRLRHGHLVMTVAFAPDGKTVVSAGGDHLVRRWDVATGREVGNYGQQDDRDKPFAVTRWLHAVAFSPDGKALATGEHADGWNVTALRIWDVAGGKQAQLLGHTDGILCVAYAPDGKTLASASNDGSVRLWDPATGATRHTLSGHQGAVRWIAWSRDGKRLASAGADGTVRLWDPDKGTELRAITAHEGGANGVDFSPDGKRLVSGGDDQAVRLWEADTGKELRKLARDRAVRPVAFAPDGKTVACGGGWDVVLWDPDTGKEVSRLTGPTNDLRSVAFSPDGKHVAAAAFATSTVYVWETETGKRLGEGPGHDGGFLGRVGYSADGRVISTTGSDGTVRQWDAVTGRPLRVIPARQTANRAAALTADGKAVAAGRWDGSVCLLDLAGKEQRRWKAHGSWVTAVACSPDGKTVASAGNDKTVVLWDTAADKELHRFDTEGGASNGMTFSHDGKLLAVVVSGQSIELRETATGKRRELRVMPGGAIRTPNGGTVSLVSAEAESAAFSADGRLLVTGDRNGVARTWDLESMQIIHPFTGHLGWVMGVALSPDGRTLAVGGWRTVHLWELSSGQQRRLLTGHEGDVSALAFAPEGRTLVSGGGDTTGLVWDLTGRLENGKPRPANLSPQELELAWTDLRGNDAARAYAALWTLAAAPKQALPLLREALPRAVPVEADRVAKLIAALDDDDFEKREQATEELAKIGAQAEAALKKALEGKPPAETRQRVQNLLERLRGSSDAEQLRQDRALELLEVMGTPEARGLLKELAKGAPEAWLTRQAQASLRRLGP